jgi:sialate O-acetylesterase
VRAPRSARVWIVKRLFLLSLLFPLFLQTAIAKPVPAGLFTDHAVLQQERPVPVWGTADAGEKISVAFAGKTYATTAGADGKWQVVLDSLAATSEPRELVIRGEADTVTLKDVLVGEVWLASGQSNMEMGVAGCSNAKAEIAEADFPLIREFAVPHKGSLQPLEAVQGKWAVCAPETVGGFSGVAYFFARDLHQKMGVPIGIIHSSFGGTPAEAWTSREALDGVPEFKAQAAEQIEIMEKTPAAIEVFPEALAAWEAENGLLDTSNEGFKNGWAAPEFDDSGWTTATAGFTLASTLKAKTGGVFWLRKAVDLPAESAGKPFRLALGYLSEQYDTVYFNGVEIASIGKTPPDFYTCPRGYHVPGDLVRAGRNVIAVRYVAHTEKGGFHEQGSRMQLPVADSKSVDNTWKIAFEREFPPVSAEALSRRPKLATMKIQNTPSALFNAMINPLIPNALRGAIWYQGESNTNPAKLAELYKKLFPLMIGDWRTRWGEPPSTGSGVSGEDASASSGQEFPFYFVQLANNGSVIRDHRDSSWAVLREAQSETLANTPNTGMAVIIDLGSDITIHPLNKQDVGKRLALWTRAKVNGETGLVFQSPLYQSHTVEAGKIRVQFDTGGSPLIVATKAGLEPARETPQAKLEWFEIAGADGKFVWADAVIDGDNSVVVSSPDVPAPTQVRYAWATNPEGCNLYSKAGLPASPFRTLPDNVN